MSPPKLSVVIPLYNERENLAALVAEIDSVRGALPAPLEVILVDDGSTDGSWGAVRELCASRPWLRGVRFLGNQGQTAAMAAGIAEARGEYLAFMDADLQNDPRDLARMLEPIVAGRADGVCGWRRDRKDRQLSRVLPSKLANAIIARSLGIALHDTGCTLKVFRRVFLEDVHLVGEMHRFIPAYAKSQGARLVEMPVNHRERKFGSSKYGLTRIYKVLIDLMTVKVLNAYGTKPAYFFGKLGLGCALFGTAAFFVVAYRTFVLHRPESTPLIFIMLLLYITALICFMSGLLAEINVRILHSSGDRRPYKIVERVAADSLAAEPAERS